MPGKIRPGARWRSRISEPARRRRRGTSSRRRGPAGTGSRGRPAAAGELRLDPVELLEVHQVMDAGEEQPLAAAQPPDPAGAPAGTGPSRGPRSCAPRVRWPAGCGDPAAELVAGRGRLTGDAGHDRPARRPASVPTRRARRRATGLRERGPCGRSPARRSSRPRHRARRRPRRAVGRRSPRARPRGPRAAATIAGALPDCVRRGPRAGRR